MADSTRDVLTGIRQQILAEGAKRLGLVIGIDRYRDSRLNLRYARADAEAMSRLMTDPECGLFAPEHVTLLCDEEATRDRIWRALATVRRKAGSGDMVWIYYAGHGALEDNDAYWIPHDGDVDDLFGTGISRRDLVRVLDEIRAKRVVVFLDCCHAAAMALRTDLARSVEAITAERAFAAYQGKGRVIVASSDGREKSVELEKVGRGAFTYFLEQGLRGEADAGRCGIVTLDTLWNFVNARVKAATRDAGHEQNPVLMGEITHGLPLTLNPLEWGRRKRLADGILARVGVGDRDLSTEEARVCLELLSMGARAEAEVAVLDAMEAFVTGTLSLAAFRHLVRATRLLPGGVAPIEVGTPAASDVAGPETHQETPVSPRTQNLMGEPATPPNVEIVKNLADILREFHFDEDAAKNILNAWSQRKKFVLAPICEHAKLERLTNGAVFIVTMQQLWEQRALTSVTRGVAFPPERQGWSFLATKPLDVRRIPEMNPQMISDIAQMCLDCGGSGIFLCSSCFGTGQAPCSFCDGVGHERIRAGWYSTTKKCSFCKGTGLVPCRKCTRKEINTPCRSCNGTGLTCFKRTPEAIDSDIWKFHVDIPKDFTEQEIKVDGNYPLALNVCPSCKGTGVWNCPNCSGTGQAPCSFCDGVGHEHMGNGWYSRDKKCPMCQGTGIRMCRRCHTNSSHKCDVCFGSGLVAEFQRLCIKITPSKADILIGNKKFSDAEGILICEINGNSGDMPEIPRELGVLGPSVFGELSAAIKANWKPNGVDTRCVRVQIKITMVPYVLCECRYNEKCFVLAIVGTGHEVHEFSGKCPTEPSLLKRLMRLMLQ